MSRPRLHGGWRLLRSGGAMGTIERPRPGGRQLEIRRNPLPGGGFVTLYTDVTARRQTEERLRQAQTMAAVGRLTAGVAHDFNNLLSSISGNAEMLHNQLGEHPVHGRRLAVILQAAGRGADLVRRLLAFSRKQSSTPMLVDLNKVVRGMGDLLRATLGRTIRVETSFEEKLWSALIDPMQIEHVILNLAINARDAMPDGGTLTISNANTTLGPHGCLDRSAARRLCDRGGERYRDRHDRGGAAQRIRAVLHHQAARPGLGTWVEPGLWRRQPIGRRGADRQRDRRGHHGQCAVPPRDVPRRIVDTGSRGPERAVSCRAAARSGGTGTARSWWSMTRSSAARRLPPCCRPTVSQWQRRRAAERR